MEPSINDPLEALLPHPKCGHTLPPFEKCPGSQLCPPHLPIYDGRSLLPLLRLGQPLAVSQSHHASSSTLSFGRQPRLSVYRNLEEQIELGQPATEGKSWKICSSVTGEGVVMWVVRVGGRGVWGRQLHSFVWSASAPSHGIRKVRQWPSCRPSGGKGGGCLPEWPPQENLPAHRKRANPREGF